MRNRKKKRLNMKRVIVIFVIIFQRAASGEKIILGLSLKEMSWYRCSGTGKGPWNGWLTPWTPLGAAVRDDVDTGS